MTVEYSLTKAEIVRSFFHSLTTSPRLLATVVIQGLFLGLIGLVVSGVFTRTLTWRDALVVFEWALGFFVFLPCWLFIRGKTAMRTLTISTTGIDTRFGTQAGAVPWSKVKAVEESGDSVLISSLSGNSFFVPARAFSEQES